MTLLHVLESKLGPGGTSVTDALGWEIERRETRDYLHRKRAQTMESGVETEIKILEGHAAEQIIAEMRELDVDLTVLSRHGEHGVTEWTLSSIAQKVVARASGSLLIVPAASRESTEWQTPPRRVLIPLDGSVRAECALAMARSIGEATGAELILTHIVGEPRGGRGPLLGGNGEELARELVDHWERSARRYLARYLSEIRTSHRAVRQVIERSADVRQALMDTMRRERVDLVVLSAHGVTCNPERAHGSVAEHLINYCDRPLILVQDLLATAQRGPAVERGMAPVAPGRLL